MKREEFYLELGHIDDDLILEAAEACGDRRRSRPLVRLVGMAACLCLVCTALLAGLRMDVVRFNEAPVPPASKVVVPADEKTTILTLTYQELFAHYGLEPFPDQLSGLTRRDPPDYYVYQDGEAGTYDANVLRYRSDDGAQSLSVLIAGEDPWYTVGAELEKRSRIDGVALVLAVSEKGAENPSEAEYWGELSHDGVYLRVVSSGMDEALFIDVIRELAGSLK